MMKEHALSYVIKAIADGNHKLSKISSALSLEGSSLTPYRAVQQKRLYSAHA